MSSFTPSSGIGLSLFFSSPSPSSGWGTPALSLWNRPPLPSPKTGRDKTGRAEFTSAGSLSFDASLLDDGGPFGDVGLHARLHFLRSCAACLHAVEHCFLFDFRKVQDVVYGAVEELHDVVRHTARARERVPALHHIGRQPAFPNGRHGRQRWRTLAAGGRDRLELSAADRGIEPGIIFEGDLHIAPHPA